MPRILSVTSLGVLLVGMLLTCQTATAKHAARPIFEHYEFEIDTRTPLKDLLPVPPRLTSGAPIVDDLALVPLVEFQEFLAVKMPKEEEARNAATRNAKVQLARQTARINFVNKQKRDRFVELLMEHRLDLAGLPFSMGDACRQKEEERSHFQFATATIHGCFENVKDRTAAGFWKAFDRFRSEDFQRLGKIPEEDREQKTGMYDHSTIAGLMQIAGPWTPEFHQGLVERLAKLDKTSRSTKEATVALARLAVFSDDAKVRQHARAALQKRDAGPADAVLLQGLRYPWPSVPRNAIDAMVQLQRKSLIPELARALEEPDPRAPTERQISGKKVFEVREVVRINHHRNCLLCHPPANTPDVMRKVREAGNRAPVDGHKDASQVSVFIDSMDGSVTMGSVPLPTEPISSAQDRGGYRPFTSPDFVVRADVTYLRQDFSMMQKVENAHPWPEWQRFDYLVRHRIVSDAEADVYRKALAAKASTYRKSVQTALRQLTGSD